MGDHKGTTALLILYTIYSVNSNVHFCSNNNKYETVELEQRNKLRFRNNCPAGLLFTDPARVDVVKDFQNSGFCINENICESSNMMCGKRKQLFMAQYITGNLTVNENLQIFENYGAGLNQKNCLFSPDPVDSLEQSSAEDAKTVQLSRKKRTTPGETVITSNSTTSKEIIDETRRLFYFMTGIHPMDVTPTTQIGKLLEPSFEVIQKRCDPSRLDPMFTSTILKAFQWLLIQAGEKVFEDISVDTAKRIKAALTECSSNPHPIKVFGSDCLETISEISLKKLGMEAVKKYEYDDKHVFQWGRYDPVIDAVWLVIDTIHGLCEPYFRKENLQHEYYVNMLHLLRIDSMQARWISPTPLFRQEIYDQVFITPLNKSMAILDACALGGSFDETYERGLRPIKYTRAKSAKRQKRSLNSQEGYSDNGQGALYELAYCLQSEQEREEKFEVLRRYQC